MSGYVFLISPDEYLSRILPLFRKVETTQIALGRGKTLVYVSNSGQVNENSLFQGYGMNHERETMIFANAPEAHLPIPAAPIEGSYFTARFDQDTVRCGADLHGFVSMVWFNTENLFAVSDSFLTLITVRRALGLPVTLDRSTVKARSWLNSMALQQLGTETFCEQINFSTPGTTLYFDLDTGNTKDEPLELESFYESSFESHAEAIELSARRMVRSIMSYAKTGALVSLALSGGQDSRVCLAAALAADIGDALHVNSNDNGTMDYAIAVNLANDFYFPLNQSGPEIHGTLVRNDVFAGWAAGSLGLYDPLYMPAKFELQERPVFMVGGQGAGLSKGAYGWRKLNDINMPDEALKQAKRSLSRIGIDPDDKWGSEWHYLAHRGALHSGRAILSTEYVSRPTAQTPLIGLSRSRQNALPAPRKGEPNVIHDMLVILNPSLAMHPFDTASKGHSNSVIHDRLEKLGGRLDLTSLEPYAVIGDIQPSQGILASHIDIAQNAGFTGALNAVTVRPFAQKAVDAYGDLMSAAAMECYESIDAKGTDRLRNARQEGVLGQLVAISAIM